MCSWQKEREEVIYLTRGLMTENSNVYKAIWKNANKKRIQRKIHMLLFTRLHFLRNNV